jgi:hypothetical protein
VVARKIPENFDAHFSFLRARKILRILVAAQSAGAHAHFSNTLFIEQEKRFLTKLNCVHIMKRI